MVDEKASWLKICRLKAMPNQALDVRILRFNGQDRIVWLENYCCSSISVASIYKKKKSHGKITMTHTQTPCSNCIALRAGKKGARPVEVGTLPSVFEKSTTKLKVKQEILKCKCPIQIVTFNVWTWNRIGQLQQLTVSAIDHSIDIICIQEHRCIYSENIKYHDTGNRWTLATAFAWKSSFNTIIGGLGIFIGPRDLKSLHSIEKIKPRMMVATFNGNLSATISYCYRPTNVSEETDFKAFSNELSSLVHIIPKHNILVIGGDMIAQIGKNVNPKFSLYNSSNRNGEHLTDFPL